jgi:hypothetical protein
MTDLDPYAALGKKLIVAAERQASNGRVATSKRGWRSNRVNAVAIAAVLVLAGGAIAAAATGVLNGSPVKQQGTPSPNAGFGVPAPGGSLLLALQTPDPQGGLPWGMRLVHTTRGELCAQIGRVDGDQLGQLGIDGAFHDDGRFHPLAPDILPNYSDSGDVTCNVAGLIRFGSWPGGDRSAAPSPERTSYRPAVKDLRLISWGLLGPHGVSVTYSTAAGVRTSPVVPGTGAYLIVSAASRVPSSINGGGELLGWTSGHEVAVGFPPPGDTSGAVIAATYRFGSFICSIGHGAPVSTSCPMPPRTPENRSAPTRRLHEPVQVKTVPPSHKQCDEAFLLYPCYRAQVQFKAPYAVTSAGSEYSVETESTCHNARPSGWSVIRDIKQGETVRSQSSGLFNCISTDYFQVNYRNGDMGAPVSRASHESVIIGTGVLGNPAEVPRLQAQAKRRLHVVIRRPVHR